MGYLSKIEKKKKTDEFIIIKKEKKYCMFQRIIIKKNILLKGFWLSVVFQTKWI